MIQWLIFSSDDLSDSTLIKNIKLMKPTRISNRHVINAVLRTLNKNYILTLMLALVSSTSSSAQAPGIGWQWSGPHEPAGNCDIPNYGPVSEDWFFDIIQTS